MLFFFAKARTMQKTVLDVVHQSTCKQHRLLVDQPDVLAVPVNVQLPQFMFAYCDAARGRIVNRKTMEASVLFPLPLDPTIAVTFPAGMARLMLLTTRTVRQAG
jgi:hypothetical protein